MKVLIVIIVCLTAPCILAQTYPDEKALGNDWEQWQDRVPISGNVRVGLMLDQTDGNFNPMEFYVIIPDSSAVNLCVELSSKDGRYSANINYNISQLNSGVQKFILPTKYKSELLQYKATDVVILATLNKDCSENAETYLISGWIKSTEGKSASVFVNSNLPTSVVIIKKDKSEVTYNCETVAFPAVAFNKKCEIPLNELKETITVVIRERKGRGNKTSFALYKMQLKF